MTGVRISAAEKNHHYAYSFWFSIAIHTTAVNNNIEKNSFKIKILVQKVQQKLDLKSLSSF